MAEQSKSKLKDYQTMADDHLWKEVASANEECEKARTAIATKLRTCVEQALIAGECPTILKDRTVHGQWQRAVAERLDIGLREVQRYMQLHDHQKELDEIDPDWKSKWTIVEALEVLRDRKAAKSTEIVQDAQDKGAETAKETETKKVVAASSIKVAEQDSLPEKGGAMNPSDLNDLREIVRRYAQSVKAIKTLKELRPLSAGVKKLTESCTLLLKSVNERLKSLEKKPARKRNAQRRRSA